MSENKWIRVIGVGQSTAPIIEEVSCLGYDAVDTYVISSQSEVVPTDDVCLTFIVALDDNISADSIGKRFHDAGVLTLGLLQKADTNCYDSTIKGASPTEYVDVIQTILKSILTPPLISYDINDLRQTLQDSGYFQVKHFKSTDLNKVFASFQEYLESFSFRERQNLSIFFNFSPRQSELIKMRNVLNLSELLSSVPATFNVSLSVYLDDSITSANVCLSVLLAGKELG